MYTCVCISMDIFKTWILIFWDVLVVSGTDWFAEGSGVKSQNLHGNSQL